MNTPKHKKFNGNWLKIKNVTFIILLSVSFVVGGLIGATSVRAVAVKQFEQAIEEINTYHEAELASMIMEEDDEIEVFVEEKEEMEDEHEESAETIEATDTEEEVIGQTSIAVTATFVPPTETASTTNNPTSLSDSEYEILAKLLYCEARGMTWEGQVYTCSAILNLSDYHGKSIWTLAHDPNTFSPASFVDTVTPLQTQYDVIDYVCSGGRIADICWFRTGHYHSFGTPVCEVDGHYFSKP